MNCVSPDLHPRKSILRKEAKLGSNHTVKFSRSTWHHKKKERKGPSRGVIQKCEPHERHPCAPQFDETKQEETLHQESCTRVSWDLAKNICKLKNADNATLCASIEASAMPAPTSTCPEEREFVADAGASMHMMRKKKAQMNCIFCEDSGDHGYSYEWVSGQKPRLTKEVKTIMCNTDNFVALVAPGFVRQCSLVLKYLANWRTKMLSN